MDDAAGLPDGYALITLDVVGSTNEEALARMARGDGHGTVVTAGRQSAGRGRRGKTWQSPPGNLYASVIVEPPAGAALGQLSFVAALGAGDALAPVAPVRFKWPNDLLLGDAKLGGILIETAARGAVVGIGINLVSAPDDTEFPATSLSAKVRGAIHPSVLLPRLCQCFEDWFQRWQRDGFAPVRKAWLERASGLGNVIEARLPTRTLTGRFAGLDADGGLMLERADGGHDVITAGEVFFAASGNG